MNLRLPPAVVIFLLFSASAVGQPMPRHIDDLGRAGFLAVAAGDPPEMTAVAGPRFLDLVPDSQREVCRILLEHLAHRAKGLYRLRVLNDAGREVMRCSL